MTLFRDEAIERRTRLAGTVVVSQPLSSYVMTAGLVGTVLVAGIWVTLGEYSRLETAPGLLVTNPPSSKIFAPVTGTIARLAVAEGDQVHKGDTLAVINLDRQSEAGNGFVRQALDVIGSRIGVSAAQRRLARQHVTADRYRLQAVITGDRQRVAGLQQQITLQREVVASTERTFAQLGDVVDKGYVSRIEYERRRQLALSAKQDLSRLQDQVFQANTEAAQAAAQIATSEVEGARDMSEIDATIGAINQQRAQIEAEGGYRVIAPIDGRVTALQAAPGRVMPPNAPMMTVVPDRAELHAELYAPTRAIGFVAPGQEVRLLYDAFPYERFGSWTGRVTSISRTIIDPRETDIPLKLEEPVYRIGVALGNQRVNANSAAIPLQAGMTLKANIVLNRQSFLDWLLAPFRAVRNRSQA